MPLTTYAELVAPAIGSRSRSHAKLTRAVLEDGKPVRQVSRSPTAGVPPMEGCAITSATSEETAVVKAWSEPAWTPLALDAISR